MGHIPQTDSLTPHRKERLRSWLMPGLLGVALLTASVAAVLWDTWPGDLGGVRLLQGMLNGYTEPVMGLVNGVGGAARPFILSLVVVAWLAYRKRHRLAAILVAVMAWELAAVALLKWVVHRPRPELPADLQVFADPSSYSFPSGHVTFATVFFGTLIYLLARHWEPTTWLRWVVLALLMVPVVLMGPARVAWGVHWPSDVLGGYLLALLGIQILVWLSHRYDPTPDERWQLEAPAPSDKRPPSVAEERL